MTCRGGCWSTIAGLPDERLRAGSALEVIVLRRELKRCEVELFTQQLPAFFHGRSEHAFDRSSTGIVDDPVGAGVQHEVGAWMVVGLGRPIRLA